MFKLYVNVEVLEGDVPDVCVAALKALKRTLLLPTEVHNCGQDPHRCPWLPIYIETPSGKPASVPPQAAPN